MIMRVFFASSRSSGTALDNFLRQRGMLLQFTISRSQAPEVLHSTADQRHQGFPKRFSTMPTGSLNHCRRHGLQSPQGLSNRIVQESGARTRGSFSRPMASLSGVRETLRHPGVRAFLYMLLFFSLKDVYDKIKASWRQIMYWDDDWDSLWQKDRTPVKNGGAEANSRQLILIRHGQYENVGADDDDVQGLTELGRRQAAETGKRLKELFHGRKISALYISNMKRAQETGKIIAEYLGDQVETIVTDPDLAEGFPVRPSPPSSYQITNQEILADFQRIETAFRRYFYRPRVASTVTEKHSVDESAEFATESFGNDSGTGLIIDGGTTGAGSGLAASPSPAKSDESDSVEVLVCHGNVIRFMLVRALQLQPTAWLRWATYNCGITWITINPQGRVSCREFGNVGHLARNEITYH